MLPSDFVVEVRNPDLTRAGQIHPDDLTDLLVVPVKNDVGSWQLTLPERHHLCGALRTPGAGLIVNGPSREVLSGPMTLPKYSASPTDPGSWTFVGVSDMIWVKDALAYGDPTKFDLAAQGSANDLINGPAETRVLQYIARNIGPAAVAERRNPRITIANDLARGTIAQSSPRFDNLLELVQEILTGTELLVDVIQVGSHLEVRVTQSADRSGVIRMDQANGQLESTEYSYSGPQLTDAIIAGQGEGTERTLLRRTVPDGGWGRRIEKFIDRRSTDDTVELTQAADKELADAAAEQDAFRVVPNTDLDLVYTRDWIVGDIVTVTVAGTPVQIPVTSAPIRINADGVFVGATVGSPRGQTWESAVNARQSDTDSRLSRLERSL